MHHGAGLLHVGTAHSAHTHSLPRLRQGHRLFQGRRVAGRKSAGCDWQLRRGSSLRQPSRTWSEKNQEAAACHHRWKTALGLKLRVVRGKNDLHHISFCFTSMSSKTLELMGVRFALGILYGCQIAWACVARAGCSSCAHAVCVRSAAAATRRVPATAKQRSARDLVTHAFSLARLKWEQILSEPCSRCGDVRTLVRQART